jgi:predicted alpha/beta superfamily hydrolase
MKHCLALLVLLLCILTTRAQEGTRSKNVKTFMLYAPQLDSSRRIWLYLPYNYQDTKKEFPVIYMHDAQNLFDSTTSYAGEWHIDETLDSLKAQVIVVGIEHGGEDRLHELTPYRNEKHGGGGADVYLDFIINILKPQIDKDYRTREKAKDTVIFGSSLGGLVSYYAVLNYPDTFGKAGVFSPSFWFTDDMYDLTEAAEAIDSKIYFMAGDSESEEMVRDMEKMEKLLLKKVKNKSQVNKKIVKGGQHSEALWAKEFAEAFLWLMQ